MSVVYKLILYFSHEPCNYFLRCYKSLCPREYVEKWKAQIQEGVFPVDLPEAKSK